MITINSIASLKSHAEAVGSKWFAPSTLAFFGSKICQGIEQLSAGENGEQRGLFVSSEKMPESYTSYGYTPAGERLYSVRIFVASKHSLSIDTVGEFQQYATENEAREAARAFAAEAVAA